MKQKLKSLRFRMLLPVILMVLFVVGMLTTLFSRAYIRMILQQEQEVNASSFDTISRRFNCSTVFSSNVSSSHSRKSEYVRQFLIKGSSI